jgi:hypothetical protein
VPNGYSLLFPGKWEGDGGLLSLISLCVFLLLIGLDPLLILRESKMILDESEALSKSCRFACCNP